MNAIDMLKEDHDAVEVLFQKIESEPPSKHKAIFKRIKDELDTHAHVEELIFYPTLKARDVKELNDVTEEGFEEHKQMKTLLEEIDRAATVEKRTAKLTVLIENVRHHVKDEEGEMFPLVEDNFTSAELEEMGDKMASEKTTFTKKNGITIRREQPKGFLEKAKEFVASALGGDVDQPKTASTRSRGSSRDGGATAQRSTKGTKSSSNAKAASVAKKSSTSSKSSASKNSSSKSSSKSLPGGKSSVSTRPASSRKSSSSSKTASNGRASAAARSASNGKSNGSSKSASNTRSNGSSKSSSGSKSGSSKSTSSRSRSSAGSSKSSGGRSRASK